MGLIPGQMQAKCIDYGQNFLTGQATSVIAATGVDIEAANLKQLADAVQDKTLSMVSDLKSTATKEVTKVGSQIGGMAGSLVGAGLSAIQGAFQTIDVAKQAVGELTTYGVQIIGKAAKQIAGMVVAFPVEVAKEATSIAAEQCKEELQQRLKEMMGTPAEEHAKKEAEKEKTNKIKKTIAWCNKAIKDVNEFKDKTLSAIQKDCEDISALMIQGPGWVNDQIGSAIDSAKTYMSDYADSKMKNVKMHYDEAVNNSAKAAASTLKKKLIDPTLEKAKDQFDNLGTSLNKTKQKAKTAIQKQLFKLAGKLGISPNG